MLTVKEIWRYPVKSMGGERLDTAAVGAHGIDGDRAWGVLDVETGNILTARREPKLLMANAHIDEGRPVIKLARGSTLIGKRDLSAWLGRPVELVPASDTGGTFENPMNVDDESDWISWQGPAGSFHDSGRTMVSLVSTTTLGDYAPARFRINIILDGEGENELDGSKIQLGTLELDVKKQIDRCIMVTRAQPGIEKDLSILKEIIRDRNNLLGIGALVAEPGRISVGDTLNPT